MSRHTKPLEPAEAILNGLLSRNRQSPDHPTNYLKAAKLCRLGEIAVMIESQRMIGLALKLLGITGLKADWDPYPALGRSSNTMWMLPAPELWEELQAWHHEQNGAASTVD